MKFKLYKEYGALNSKEPFDAIEKAILKLNHQIVDKNEDVSVIWSVLWNGRMLGNQKIYEENLKLGKKTLIIEVGNLYRGKTWRLAMSHIDKTGIFGNDKDLDPLRPKKLGVELQSFKENRKEQILITCQHDKSLQWQGQPLMIDWVNSTIAKIKQYTNREILVRPHPRCPLRGVVVGATIVSPKKLLGTYDDFDINYNFHCVINHNSGPGVQSVIQGTPIVCHSSSLAYEVSDKLENIENLKIPDRNDWLLRLTHTEWTINEIAQGGPLQRIIQSLS